MSSHNHTINEEAPIWKFIEPEEVSVLIYMVTESHTYHKDSHINRIRLKVQHKMQEAISTISDLANNIQLNLLNTAKSCGLIKNDVEFEIENGDLFLKLENKKNKISRVKMPTSCIDMDKLISVDVSMFNIMTDKNFILNKGQIKEFSNMKSGVALYLCIKNSLDLYIQSTHYIDNAIRMALLKIIECESDSCTNALSQSINAHKELADIAGVKNTDKSIASMYIRYLESVDLERLYDFGHYHTLDFQDIKRMNIELSIMSYLIFDKMVDIEKISSEIADKFIDEIKFQDDFINDLLKDGYKKINERYELIIKTMKYGEEDKYLYIKFHFNLNINNFGLFYSHNPMNRIKYCEVFNELNLRTFGFVTSWQEFDNKRAYELLENLYEIYGISYEDKKNIELILLIEDDEDDYDGEEEEDYDYDEDEDDYDLFDF